MNLLVLAVSLVPFEPGDDSVITASCALRLALTWLRCHSLEGQQLTQLALVDAEQRSDAEVHCRWCWMKCVHQRSKWIRCAEVRRFRSQRVRNARKTNSQTMASVAKKRRTSSVPGSWVESTTENKPSNGYACALILALIGMRIQLRGNLKSRKIF